MGASAPLTKRLADMDGTKDVGGALLELLGDFASLSTPSTVQDDLKAVGDFLFDNPAGVVSARQVLDALASRLRAVEDDGARVEVGEHLLARLAGAPQASYPEQVAALCEQVAAAHENLDNFQQAARALGSIPLDSSQRRVSSEDKARVWVRIVRNYLEDGDSTAAEAYLNKLKGVIFDVRDAELGLHFRLAQARINDAKRDFLAAAMAYHDISYSPAVAEEERLHTLSAAITCAVLAPAGPSRSRVLARLYKDDRAGSLDEFSILENMFLHRLLTPAEVAKFAQRLEPHHLARTADGTTVLDKAVVEHNLLGVSLLFRNIQLDNLAHLLGLDAPKAEETTARMIEQGRLLGRIDQIDGLVYFEAGEASGEKGSGRTDSAVDKELRQWDANVQSVAEEVENISNTLQQHDPDFVAQNLAV